MIRSHSPISGPIGMARAAARPASAPGRSRSIVRIHAVFSRQHVRHPVVQEPPRELRIARAVPGESSASCEDRHLLCSTLARRISRLSVRFATRRSVRAAASGWAARVVRLRKRTWGQDRAPPLCERAAVHRIPCTVNRIGLCRDPRLTGRRLAAGTCPLSVIQPSATDPKNVRRFPNRGPECPSFSIEASRTAEGVKGVQSAPYARTGGRRGQALREVPSAGGLKAGT